MYSKRCLVNDLGGRLSLIKLENIGAFQYLLTVHHTIRLEIMLVYQSTMVWISLLKMKSSNL